MSAAGGFGMGPEIYRKPIDFIIQPKSLTRLITLIFSFISFCCIVSIRDTIAGCIFDHTSTCGFVKFVTCLACVHCKWFMLKLILYRCLRHILPHLWLVFSLTCWFFGYDTKKTNLCNVRNALFRFVEFILFFLILRMYSWLEFNKQ